jgi:hypothetical protein
LREPQRIFVENLPPHYTWMDLKDLFRNLEDPISQSVAFTSVSIDQTTGISKGKGIVQFEDSSCVKRAIKLGMDGGVVAIGENGEEHRIYIKEDVKARNTVDREPRPDRNRAIGHEKRRAPRYECGNVDHDLDDTTLATIETLIAARLDARYRRNFDTADAIRKQLFDDHKVRLDDRAKLWFLDYAPAPHAATWARARKKEGEVLPDFVDEERLMGLLERRDAARLRRDYATADELMKEMSQTVSEKGWRIVLDDEKKKWQVWKDRSSF